MSEQEKRKFETNRYTYITATVSVMAVMVYNGLRRKYLWQGIHKHTLAALIGAYTGTKLGIWGDHQTRKKDFIIEEYISRHPEKFEKPPVKLVGEKLTRWAPVR